MMSEQWVAAAFTTDEQVAELLLRLKQSSSTDSSPATTSTAATASLNPIAWGDRKSRSKPSTTATIAVGKGQQQQRSPSTPLSLSGGARPSTSDSYDESRLRQVDHYSGDRSVKIDLHQDLEKENKKISLKVESEINIQNRRFVLPDLNEIPAYEEFIAP